MIPSSFCTIATEPCKQELTGFLFSLSIHHQGAHVYVMCDKATQLYIKNGYIPKLKIIWDVSLDTYSKYTRGEMEKLGIWSKFQMSKADIIEKALQFEKDTLFLDSDIIILDEINDIQQKELGVSPGFVNQEIATKYGYYNGGMLWTNQRTLPSAWRKYTQNSRYYDQASIEDLCKDYKYFEFKDNYNLQTWRFICGEEASKIIMSHITIKNNKLMYKQNPLKFIHTHFNLPHFQNINNYFINMLQTAKYYRELVCIYYVIQTKWHFILANTSTPWNELVLLMSKRKIKLDVSYELGNNNYTNMNLISFKYNIHVMDKIIQCLIPTKPVLLERMMCCLPYEERTNELFYPDKNEIREMYTNISKSKYGKCNMEKCNMVELMAFGTVPILKMPCIEHDYYILEKDYPLSIDEWTALSKMCYLWYLNNKHSSMILYPIIDRIFE